MIGVLLIIIGLGIIIGFIGRAKSSIEIKKETAKIELEKRNRQTNSKSYGIGSLYSDGEYEGMVIAVDSTQKHGRFFDFSANGRKWNVEKALDQWHVYYGTPELAKINDQTYNKDWLFTIPTIQDLKVLGDNIERFYQLRDERRTGGLRYSFPNVRFEDLGIARKILSRTLTSDAKNVYVYDMLTKQISTMPISTDDMKYDDEDITCGIILVGFF